MTQNDNQQTKLLKEIKKKYKHTKNKNSWVGMDFLFTEVVKLLTKDLDTEKKDDTK